MSRFWQHYEAAKPHVTSAVDDVRHKLVEEAWFGRTTTGGINDLKAWPEKPIPKKEAETTELQQQPAAGVSDAEWSEVRPADTTPFRHRHHDLYESLWGREPQGAEIYGQRASIEHKGPEPIEPEV